MMQEYEVLKPFQHIHGYKRPGDVAELSPEEAKEKIASGHVKPGEEKPKRRKPVIEDEG
jgi:hypothetical protein